MASAKKRLLVLSLALWSLSSQATCTTNLPYDLTGRPCPCLPGWDQREQGDTCICVLAGGSSGIAGQAGTAGVNGTGCPANAMLHAFDSDTEGFTAMYVNPATLNTTLAWDGATGEPGLGSLSIEAVFTGNGQGVLVGRRTAEPLDLTGKLLTARLRLDRDPALTGPYTATNGSAAPASGAKIYIKTGSGDRYSSGSRAHLVSGGWIPLVFDPTHPSYVANGDASAIELSDVRELGIDIDTEGAGEFATGALHIDSFGVQPGHTPAVPPWNFDCSTEGFNITYMTHGSLNPSFGWSAGAVLLSAAFDGPGQEIGVGRAMGNAGLDLRGKTLSAKVRLDAGLSADPSHRGTAKLYVATGPQYLCGVGSPEQLAPNAKFVTLTIDVDSPSFTCAAAGAIYDASKVMELGIIVNSETGGTVQPATLTIDEVALAP
jgi:hypothetical protein